MAESGSFVSASSDALARTGTWLRGLLPRQSPMLTHERLLACLGALVGITLTALITRWSLGTGFAMPLLIAPIGASAVLVFAVPASPLAQPWSVVAGNTLSALAGVTCAQLIVDPTLAAARRRDRDRHHVARALRASTGRRRRSHRGARRASDNLCGFCVRVGAGGLQFARVGRRRARVQQLYAAAVSASAIAAEAIAPVTAAAGARRLQPG